MADDREAVAEGLRALASFVVGDGTMGETLDRVVRLASAAVAGADMAAITILGNGKPTTAIFTNDIAPAIDSAQYDNDSGPCLDAFRSRVVNRIESMSDEQRWPEFVALAVKHGIGSTLSLPLVVRDECVGALNFYAYAERAFSPSSESVGVAFADQSAVVLANALAYWGVRQLADELDEALKSRATIEQAKGIIMATNHCDPDAAFEVLKRASQRTNTKLRSLALDIVERAQEPKVDPSHA